MWFMSSAVLALSTSIILTASNGQADLKNLKENFNEELKIAKRYLCKELGECCRFCQISFLRIAKYVVGMHRYIAPLN